MAYKMKGPTFYGKSPLKQTKTKSTGPTEDHVVINGKTYPKGYTQADVDRLKKQNEDVVRREDLDEAGKKIWDRNQARKKAKKKSLKVDEKSKADYYDKGGAEHENADEVD